MTIRSHQLKTTLALCAMISSTALANNNFPKGCEVSGFGYTGPYVILNDTQDQTFYLIQNRSQGVIELERFETRDVFMSPKLETKIGANQWAAFASDVSNIHFQCFYTLDGNRTPVNCSEVLELCQYPRVKFALSNMGSYWVSTDKPLQQVIKDATAKGIYLKW